MPFPLRTVAPLKLCRLEEGAAAAAAAVQRDKDGHARRSGAGLRLFDSLEEVCSRSLVSLVWQLSDLSRWASDIFSGIQSEADSLGRRSVRLQCRLESLKALAGCLDHRKVKVPVSNLDEESRWTVHYTAPWHQQENVFLPSTRPPCVEELHRQAKLNLKSVLRECDKLRRDGCRSSQYYSQGPTFSSSSSTIYGSYQDDYEEIEQKHSTPSPEEEKLIPVKRPKTPTPGELSDINTQTNWTKSLPLPTPEEKMRQQAQAVPTDVIPINVTGENFDRQASIRRSLVYTDIVVRRPKKMKRRKTITGIPDNIQRELVGNGKCDIRGHSLCVPDHYSTLGRLEGYQSSMQQCGTKDSSCQTEEVKVVPPSVRRIRAQKGQGIAAQMSQFSSSSGNMSVMSDSAGVMSTSRLNNDLGFHSLPRSGARVSLQLLERRHSLSKSTESGPLLHHVGVWQGNERIDDMRNGCRIDGLQRPKSQELNSENGKTENTACMISPHVAYSTIITPNASLSSSSDVMNNNPAESSETLDKKMMNSLYLKPRDNLVGNGIINAKEQRCSSNSTWSDTSSIHHSHSSDTTISSNGVMVFVSFCDTGTTESVPQSVTYNFSNDHRFSNHSHNINGRSESSYTVNNIQDKVKQNAKQCGFKPSGNDTTLHMSKRAIPGCSSPDSLERVLAKEDSHSLYSVDNDICYPSMHVDSDVQSVKSCSENGFGNPRHSVINVFARTEKKSMEDFASSNDKSLTRSISFKKAKKPPLPPSRTDSLRRIPKNKPQSSGQVLDDKLIASLQHSLQLNLQCKNGSSPSQSPCSDYDDPWMLRSRSQSTVSASSSMMSATGLNMYSICAVTPAQSDTSSIKSEYTDQWCYYSDYPGTPDNHLKSAAIHSSNTLPKLIDYNVSHLSDESRASIPPVPSGVAKAKAISPEKSQRVTSPSSGYSSQSNTPTALTPVPVVLKSMSTGNAKSKMKPRVPERKSSLLSSVSVSSSSTSLSSNTSAEGTMKKPDPTLSFPPVTLSSLVSSDSNDPPLPPPPPLLADVTDVPQPPESPSFPPPPPDVVTNASFPQSIGWFNNQDISNHSSHSLLPDSSQHPPSTFPTSVPPPAPPLDPKFMRDGHKPVPYSFKKRNLEGSCNNAKRPLNKDVLPGPAMPLITTEALQRVQLRSVKKAMTSEVEQSAESASKASPQEKNQDSFSAELLFGSHLSGGYNDTLGAVGDEAQRSPVCSPNSRRSEPTCAKMPRNAISTIINSFARESQPDKAEEASVQNQDPCGNLACSSLQEQSGFLSKPQDLLPNKKPPPVSKKPKLFLFVPPPQPDVTTEKIAVGETARSIPSTTMKDAEIAWYSQVNNSPTDGFGSYEMESSDPVPEGGAASPTSCESRVSILQPRQEEPVSSCEQSSPDRNVDSISGAEKQFSQGDESSEAIEADAATSFLLQSPSHGEGSEIMAVPSRPRTTEDLFAAIHRSKRKVLGRKDSEDDHAPNHSPSPPVTPTGSSPNLPSLRQAGSIQRNIRKSSTSNDNFKALLLKKGSRSDTSSRMSAAEMLKNTDPRFQRARVDSTGELSESMVASPTKTKRPQEEWAKSEGLMPRSLSLSSTRYGRSRTPPSAASSKYSARNRIQSSPMTVICEGDVEVVESGESRTRRFSEEESPDVFESDDADFNENRDSTEDDNMLMDLLS